MNLVSDKSVDQVDPSKPEGLCKLLGLLCGQDVEFPAAKEIGERFATYSAKVKEPGIGMRDINELLILLAQNITGPGFYEQFFGDPKGLVSSDALKAGLRKFRMMAILRRGNFRYCFQSWRSLTSPQIQEKLGEFGQGRIEREALFPGRVIKIDRISKDKTYATGGISAKAAIQEFQVALGLCKVLGADYDPAAAIETARKGGLIKSTETLAPTSILRPPEEIKAKWKPEEAKAAADSLNQRIKEVIESRSKAKVHLTDYLLAPRIDVYVATSMRETWEFEETAQDLETLFESGGTSFLRKLDYFDPTQCYCESIVDKGLVEGLVLSRVRATLYMAQEGDTLGKDSELASTLARGKPVIAYVPRIVALSQLFGKADKAQWDLGAERAKIEEWAKRLQNRPIHFFYRRLLLLEAGNVLGPDFQLACEANFDFKGVELIQKFREQYSGFNPLFSLLSREHEQFRKDQEAWFPDFLRAFVIAEAINFDKRADVLRYFHPLGMQIDIREGVANGVLVARSLAQCAALLEKMLLNEATFVMDEQNWGEEKATVLLEDASKSRYRVVTSNPILTSSFWNFFQGA